MARKKTPKVRINVKAMVSGRLREVRNELFGEHGGPELARQLGLPARTWYNYETGVTVPAEVLLTFIEQTGVNPVWLLTGNGPKFRRGVEDHVLAELSPEQLIRRGLEKLEREPSEITVVAPGELPTEILSDFIAVGMTPLDELADGGRADRFSQYILAFREWIPHPRETIAVELTDDSMHPILPSGSIVAVDRSFRDIRELQSKIVAAAPEGKPMIRWLEVSGKHVILRPNHTSRETPMIPVELDDVGPDTILGQVCWSWSRFANN